jgi:hypothetical protein
MAVRNHIFADLWQKVRQDSVSWGSLALWVSGLVLMLIILARFFQTQI